MSARAVAVIRPAPIIIALPLFLCILSGKRQLHAYRYRYDPTPWILAIARRPLGCRTEEVISSRDSTRTLEQTRSGSSEDKAANMRQVCHASGLHVCHSACVEELSEKPKTN